jgi:hypothetical protein
MNKKVLISFAALAIAATAALNLGFSSHKSELSALSMANVEALAASEGSENRCYTDPSYFLCYAWLNGYYCPCDYWW